jgi:hypothetical protein
MKYLVIVAICFTQTNCTTTYSNGTKTTSFDPGGAIIDGMLGSVLRSSNENRYRDSGASREEASRRASEDEFFDGL